MINARVVLSSVNPCGVRLVTFALTYPRFIHAQVMTHRVFSRSVASSRAIPIEKMIEDVEKNLVMPIYWGKSQKGMVAEFELSAQQKARAELAWINAAKNAMDTARELAEIGLHKEYANRVLEPFTHTHTVLSTTDLDNFFDLRISDHAQPEIKELAIRMKYAMTEVVPVWKNSGEWHLPFTAEEEENGVSLEDRLLISAARCARISYGSITRKDINSELELAKRLIKDKHLSPLEHQAMAINSVEKSGNFRGWIQQRVLV